MHKLLDNITINFDLSQLISAINSNSAVVYVGAGASIPAGLPGWKGFLEACIDRNWKVDQDNPKWILPKKLLEEGDYLTCAELLQREIGQSLEQYVWDVYGKASSPSEIHKAIARIPFSLAITTNYDRLLESAYPYTPNVWTWRDPQAVFSAFKNNRFSVVKIHGDVGNGPSLVLTRTQYRDFMHLNKALNDCLTTLFSLKTFLFVGSSLRDQNILSLMENARLTHGSAFGPHYAILFTNEVDQPFSDFLREAFNINVISCAKPKDCEGDWRTEAVCSVMKLLSGKASQYHPRSKPWLLDSPSFNLRDISGDIVTDVLQRTGSDRGKIAFVENIDRHGLYKMAEVDRTKTVFSKSSVKNKNKKDAVQSLWQRELIDPNSMLGHLFLSSNSESDHLYIKNMDDQCKIDTDKSKERHIYKPSHSDVKSVLACQVRADGQRIGVVVIESFSVDAFTVDHLATLKESAKEAGSAFTEFRHRELSSQGIEPYFKQMNVFQELMDLSRQLKPLELSYILYKIDYSKGIVVPKFDQKTLQIKGSQPPFSYKFHEKSLVTEVLHSREECIIEDVEEAIRMDHSSLAKKGIEYFNIKGPCYGVPIRVDGHISSVLVVWSRKGENQFIALKERIYRLAHLIANAPDRDQDKLISDRISYQFIKTFNGELEKVDENSNWKLSQLKNPDFQQAIMEALMKALAASSSGPARVRLWKYVTPKSGKGEYFECIYSYTCADATLNGKAAINNHRGVRTDSSDPFCRYTIARAGKNPYALLQHPSMLGEVDKNTEALQKDPDGSWIVCPIYKRGGKERLLGFISADNHMPSGTKGKENVYKERKLTEREATFQRLAVDLVADLMINILFFHGMR